MQFRKSINKWLQLSPDLLECWETAYAAEPENVFPIPARTFLSMEYFDPKDTKVVILGQDPYHKRGKASGLAFGYNTSYEGPLDSSLLNVLHEAGYTDETLMQMESLDRKSVCSLKKWAKQDVLLLNTRLTVTEGKPLSHSHIGWESAVLKLLRQLDAINPEIIWLCWGAEAREMVDELNPRGSVIATSHPCRYSNTRGSTRAPAFTGSKCFDQVNEILKHAQEETIEW